MMKKFAIVIGAVLALLSLPAWAQVTPNSVNLHGTLTPGNCVSGYASKTIQDSGIDCSGGTGEFMLKNGSNAVLPAARNNLGAAAGDGASLNPVTDGYGAVCDGTTDDTAAINNAIAALMAAKGGTLVLPGICRMNSAMAIPFTGTAPPLQPPLRITSLGSAWGGGLIGAATGGGGGLDLRYSGGGSQVAKIDTRGQGVLEIDHLTIKDGSTDNYLFIQTTNTTLNIHDNHFIGNTACTVTATPNCAQDVIQLGGITDASTTLGGVLSTNGFQGYGSRISNNLFSYIRHAVNFGGSANGVFLDNNTTDKTSGTGETIGCPYFFYGAGLGASGNVISGGIVEMNGYPYALCFSNVTAVTGVNKLNTSFGLGLYDETLGSVTVGAYYFSSATLTVLNTITDGFVDTALQAVAMNGPGAATNTHITGGGGTFFQNAVSLGGVLSASVLGTTSGGQIGAQSTTGSGAVVLQSNPIVLGLTNGAGTGSAILSINGANSGSGNGSALFFKNAGVTTSAVGGYSAVLGGAYNNNLSLYSGSGGAIIKSLSAGGFAVRNAADTLDEPLTASTGTFSGAVSVAATAGQVNAAVAASLLAIKRSFATSLGGS